MSKDTTNEEITSEQGVALDLASDTEENKSKAKLEKNDVKDLKISQHAKERYAERVADKDSKLELNLFLQKNDAKITADITKMVEYGRKVYFGKTNGGNKLNSGQKVNIFVNGAWVILIGTDNSVITLYKKDLGVEEEFSKEYVEKLSIRIQEALNELETVKRTVQSKNTTIQNNIKENTLRINEYKARIKELEEANKGYEKIKAGNLILVKEAEDTVMEIVDRFTTVTK